MGFEVTDTTDFVQSFQIEGMNVRGRVVHLTDVAERVLGAHGYPDVVSGLVAEALTIAVLLGASLKFNGMLTLQTRSTGSVRMIVADYTSPGIVRACATFDREAVESLGPSASFEDLVGTGSLAITIDPGEDMERYQGVVPLDEDGLAQSAIGYFERSEQIPTAIKVSAAMLSERGQGTGSTWRAGGIMIQNLAALGGTQTVPSDIAEEAWTRASTLFATVDGLELVDPQVESERLLYRLFHEDGVRAFAHQPLEFGCRCSAERVMSVLSRYSREELSDLVESDGMIGATCEFCSTTYRINPDDLTNGEAATP
ncbi:MAG: Hsp33 family molecular chaperone [Alphaproteobacteria bacterium]|nr:Hsp33 family molecular chaperone [Alphaproteobacteria bacterium]